MHRLIRETVIGIRVFMRVKGALDGFVRCSHNLTQLAQVRSDDGSNKVNCPPGLSFRPLVFLPCASISRSVHPCGAGGLWW